MGKLSIDKLNMEPNSSDHAYLFYSTLICFSCSMIGCELQIDTALHAASSAEGLCHISEGPTVTL